MRWWNFNCKLAWLLFRPGSKELAGDFGAVGRPDTPDNDGTDGLKVHLVCLEFKQSMKPFCVCSFYHIIDRHDVLPIEAHVIDIPLPRRSAWQKLNQRMHWNPQQFRRTNLCIFTYIQLHININTITSVWCFMSEWMREGVCVCVCLMKYRL